MDVISDLFNVFLVDPLTNLFVLLSTFTGNAGIAIVVLTLGVRGLTYRWEHRQARSNRKVMMLPRQIEENRSKYNDPMRQHDELFVLLRGAGSNRLGCIAIIAIQVPFLFALYFAFAHAVSEAPESLVRLSDRLYGWDYLRSRLPLDSRFLWMRLGQPDLVILPIAVAATSYVLLRTGMMPTTVEKRAAAANVTGFLIPLSFGFITLSLPSGLALAFLLSNLIGIVIQYAPS